MAKLFRREQHSLFGEILDWMLTPLLLLWPVSLILTWLVAQNIAARPFDRGLEYNVQALAQLVKSDQTRMYFNLPLPAREILRADEADMIYYQVLGTRGEFVSGERDFPLPSNAEQTLPGEVRLRDDEMRGAEVRVAYTWYVWMYRVRDPCWCKWVKRWKNAPCWPQKLSKASCCRSL